MSSPLEQYALLSDLDIGPLVSRAPAGWSSNTPAADAGPTQRGCCWSRWWRTRGAGSARRAVVCTARNRCRQKETVQIPTVVVAQRQWISKVDGQPTPVLSTPDQRYRAEVTFAPGHAADLWPAKHHVVFSCEVGWRRRRADSPIQHPSTAPIPTLAARVALAHDPASDRPSSFHRWVPMMLLGDCRHHTGVRRNLSTGRIRSSPQSPSANR